MAILVLAAACGAPSSSVDKTDEPDAGGVRDARPSNEAAPADAVSPTIDGNVDLDSGAITPPVVSCSAFRITRGAPTDAMGARWSYSSVDDGETFFIEGVVFAPPGAGPFPALVLSHGAGSGLDDWLARVGPEFRDWGLVVVAVLYTHHKLADGGVASDGIDGYLPDGGLGASPANVERAHKARDLLTCLGTVDMMRIAAHGHSMGAFVTGQLVGTYVSDFRAASHTAGGTNDRGPNATHPAAASAIRTPYQLHHGSEDPVVLFMYDQNLDGILTSNGVAHEFHRYDYAPVNGTHQDHSLVSVDPVMFQHVHDWYARNGVLR
jgi:dienelactone hydrolase